MSQLIAILIAVAALLASAYSIYRQFHYRPMEMTARLVGFTAPGPSAPDGLPAAHVVCVNQGQRDIVIVGLLLQIMKPDDPGAYWGYPWVTGTTRSTRLPTTVPAGQPALISSEFTPMDIHTLGEAAASADTTELHGSIVLAVVDTKGHLRDLRLPSVRLVATGGAIIGSGFAPDKAVAKFTDAPPDRSVLEGPLSLFMISSPDRARLSAAAP